jgi:hypothetical protein
MADLSRPKKEQISQELIESISVEYIQALREAGFDVANFQASFSQNPSIWLHGFFSFIHESLKVKNFKPLPDMVDNLQLIRNKTQKQVIYDFYKILLGKLNQEESLGFDILDYDTIFDGTTPIIAQAEEEDRQYL